jgi:hypothetical protein
MLAAATAHQGIAFTTGTLPAGPSKVGAEDEAVRKAEIISWEGLQGSWAGSLAPCHQNLNGPNPIWETARWAPSPNLNTGPGWLGA